MHSRCCSSAVSHSIQNEILQSGIAELACLRALKYLPEPLTTRFVSWLSFSFVGIKRSNLPANRDESIRIVTEHRIEIHKPFVNVVDQPSNRWINLQRNTSSTCECLSIFPEKRGLFARIRFATDFRLFPLGYHKTGCTGLFTIP